MSSAVIYELLKTQADETRSKLKIVSLNGKVGQACLAGDQVLETGDCQPG